MKGIFKWLRDGVRRLLGIKKTKPSVQQQADRGGINQNSVRDSVVGGSGNTQVGGVGNTQMGVGGNINFNFQSPISGEVSPFLPLISVPGHGEMTLGYGVFNPKTGRGMLYQLCLVNQQMLELMNLQKNDGYTKIGVVAMVVDRNDPETRPKKVFPLRVDPDMEHFASATGVMPGEKPPRFGTDLKAMREAPALGSVPDLKKQISEINGGESLDLEDGEWGYRISKIGAEFVVLPIGIRDMDALSKSKPLPRYFPSAEQAWSFVEWHRKNRPSLKG